MGSRWVQIEAQLISRVWAGRLEAYLDGCLEQ